MANRLGDDFGVLLPGCVIVWQDDNPLTIKAFCVILQPLSHVIAGAARIAGCDEAEPLKILYVLFALDDQHLLGGRHPEAGGTTPG